MTDNRPPFDVDPLAVPFVDADVYDRGWDAGYAAAAGDRRLSIVPFAWGLVGGAAVAIIVVLLVLVAPR